MEFIGALLIDAARKWKEGVTAALTPIGLTTNAYLLLDAIYKLQQDTEVPSQAAAARIAKLDVNLAAQTMKFLTQHHLVHRTQNTTDSRSYIVTLTLAGTQQLYLAGAAVAAFEASFYKDIQRQHFADALRSLIN